MNIMFDAITIGKKVFTGVMIYDATVDDILSFMSDDRIETMQVLVDKDIPSEPKKRGRRPKAKLNEVNNGQAESGRGCRD